MAETNFTLHSTDTNNYNVQKTFSGVNPEATSAELVETAQGFNRLTDNTYVGTKRIDKINCDTEGIKPTPTLTLGDVNSLGDDYYSCLFTYNGDGILTARVEFDNHSGSSATTAVSVYYENNGVHFRTGANTAGPATITVVATETDNYKYAVATTTFTK